MAAKQERDFYAEARLLIRNAGSATLATAQAGIPHAALVTLAFTGPPKMPELQPILLLSTLAMHTNQLLANPACALLLTGELNGPNPQTTPRLCLTGNAVRTESQISRSIFLARHPYAGQYADFADFAFWQVVVSDAYYIGGFGAARKLLVAKLSTPQ